MPIIMILLLTTACAPLPWPEPPLGIGASGALTLTALAMLLPLCLSAILSRWTVSALRTAPERRSIIARKYTRWRRWLGYWNLVAGFIAIVWLGWGWAVWHSVWLGDPDAMRLAPFGELLVPAPYVLSLWLTWLLHYEPERAFHNSSLAAVRSFGSPVEHFLFQLRPFAFLIVLPMLLFSARQTFVRYAPETASSDVATIASFLMVPLLVVLMPLAVKPIMGLKTMPPGVYRSQLEQTAAKHRFRVRNLLLWPTRGAVANAMVVGVLPQARYVVFTDRLLESLQPDELDAVFGHEIGHVKHWHIPYYAVFLMLSAAVVTSGTAVVMHELLVNEWYTFEGWGEWVGVPPLVVLAGYLFIVFGFLSRRCERQADIHGCRIASGGGALSTDGIEAMIRALGRVADANGMETSANDPRWYRRWLSLFRSWLHGSIGERIAYLQRLNADPTIERRYQWQVFGLRILIVVALSATLYGIGSWVGWEDFVEAL